MGRSYTCVYMMNGDREEITGGDSSASQPKKSAGGPFVSQVNDSDLTEQTLLPLDRKELDDAAARIAMMLSSDQSQIHFSVGNPNLVSVGRMMPEGTLAGGVSPVPAFVSAVPWSGTHSEIGLQPPSDSGHHQPFGSIAQSLSGVGESLLNAIGEGVALTTRDGGILWSNEFVRALTGEMIERLSVCSRQFDREFPLPPPSVDATVALAANRKQYLLADDERAFQVVITPLLHASKVGLPQGSLVIVVTDVSSTRKLQYKIAAIDQAGAELMRIDADVVRKFNAHERLGLLRERIVKFAGSLLHFDHFAIRLLDERDDRLQLIIGHNVPPEYDGFIIRPRLEGHGITGYVAASGQTYVCNNIQDDKLYLPGVEGAKSSLTIPLRINDRVIGVMNVESMRDRAFSDEDRQLGEIFARYIAMSINLLDLLVIERVVTNQTVAGRVTHELDEPLQDIAHQVELLLIHDSDDQYVKDHLKQISNDLVSIRNRIKECAAGPQTLLGVERAMADNKVDPDLLGKRILVADDELNIRRIIDDYLSMKGCKVKVFSNGRDAINELNANPMGFDMILSDIRMPDANGYELFAAAREACPGVPVILMTGFGYDPHHSIVRAHQEGLQAVLFKPFQLRRLLDDVKKALGIEI